VGRDITEFSRIELTLKFQSTRPRGARLNRIGIDSIDDVFQSTRPRGARLDREGGKMTSKKFQSTRPRGARPTKDGVNVRPSTVSIHAPAWGATTPYTIYGSIPASFNPRARVGRDLKLNL